MQLETGNVPRWRLRRKEYCRRYQGSNLEGEISDVFQSLDFDEDRFNKFFDNIFLLVGGQGSQNQRFVTIEDIENNTVIAFSRKRSFKWRKIMITQNSPKDDGGFRVSHKRLTYMIDDACNERQPHLYSSDFEYNAPISDKTLKNLCYGIFNRYLVLQNKPQPKPQNSVG